MQAHALVAVQALPPNPLNGKHPSLPKTRTLDANISNRSSEYSPPYSSSNLPLLFFLAALTVCQNPMPFYPGYVKSLENVIQPRKLEILKSKLEHASRKRPYNAKLTSSPNSSPASSRRTLRPYTMSSPFLLHAQGAALQARYRRKYGNTPTTPKGQPPRPLSGVQCK